MDCCDYFFVPQLFAQEQETHGFVAFCANKSRTPKRDHPDSMHRKRQHHADENRNTEAHAGDFLREKIPVARPAVQKTRIAQLVFELRKCRFFGGFSKVYAHYLPLFALSIAWCKTRCQDGCETFALMRSIASAPHSDVQFFCFLLIEKIPQRFPSLGKFRGIVYKLFIFEIHRRNSNDYLVIYSAEPNIKDC